MRGAVHRRVEPPVARQLGRRRVRSERLQPGQAVGHLGEVGGGAALGGQAGGQRVEVLPELDEVPCLRGVERGHPGVPVRAELDQTLLGQPPQGLAQRGGADADAPGQRGLVEHRAGLQLAAEDHLPHPRVGQLALGGDADLVHRHNLRTSLNCNFPPKLHRDVLRL